MRAATTADSEGEAAIKLLRNGLFDATAQERFRREGAVLSRLRRPGIAQLLDAGVNENHQPYMVLELVRGERIDEWCDARGLSTRARIELFLQVLDAVATAHSLMVIHRDLKPSNILVDEAARVTLLDFGIAHLLPEADVQQTALTAEGSAGFTPRYAAPEQFRQGAVSMATDVHALGIVLFELLTHAHPAGARAGSGPLDWMQSAVDGRYVAASAAAPKLRRELRGDIDTILAKSIAVEPRDRYPSATAMREDLQRHLANEPIVARPASPWYRCAKLVRRRPIESAAALAIVLAIPAGTHVQAAVLVSFAAGIAVALWQLRAARLQAAKARIEQRRAEAVTEFIASTFSQAIPRAGSGGVVTAGDLLHSAHKRIRNELRGEPMVAARLMGIVADSFNELGDVAAASGVLPEAVARGEQAFGWTHPTTLHARTALAEVRGIQGELEKVEQTLPGLIEDLKSAMPASAADLVAALRNRSYVLTKRGDVDGSIASLHEALAIARPHFGEASRTTLATEALLGSTLATFGRDLEAIAILEPAVAVARKAFGALRPNHELAQLEGYLAPCLIGVDRVREAEELLQQVLADQWALDGCDTIRNRLTRNMLALVHAKRGASQAALATMREALAAEARLEPEADGRHRDDDRAVRRDARRGGAGRGRARGHRRGGEDRDRRGRRRPAVRGDAARDPPRPRAARRRSPRRGAGRGSIRVRANPRRRQQLDRGGGAPRPDRRPSRDVATGRGRRPGRRHAESDGEPGRGLPRTGTGSSRDGRAVHGRRQDRGRARLRPACLGHALAESGSGLGPVDACPRLAASRGAVRGELAARLVAFRRAEGLRDGSSRSRHRSSPSAPGCTRQGSSSGCRDRPRWSSRSGRRSSRRRGPTSAARG